MSKAVHHFSNLDLFSKIFYLHSSANYMQIISNFHNINILITGTTYTRIKEKKQFFRKKTNLCFSVILGISQVKSTTWRWYHTSNLMQFSRIKNLMSILKSNWFWVSSSGKNKNNLFFENVSNQDFWSFS